MRTLCRPEQKQTKEKRKEKRKLRNLHGLCYHVSLGVQGGCDEGAINSTKRNRSAFSGPLWNPRSLPSRECAAATGVGCYDCRAENSAGLQECHVEERLVLKETAR